jgi:hypothetical protein
MRFTLSILSIVLLSTALSVQARLYKWADEEGQIHFGDRIPPKYQVKAHDELNEQGVTTRHRPAMKTAKEKAEDRRLENERRKEALIVQKKKQRDRVLLDTYTTERDLVLARDSRLDAVGSQIRLAESIVSDSHNNIASMEKQITQVQESNREVPTDLYDRLDGEKRQVVVQTQVLENHKTRQQEISEQFNGYIKRFRVLKAKQKAKREKFAKDWGYEAGY